MNEWMKTKNDLMQKAMTKKKKLPQLTQTMRKGPFWQLQEVQLQLLWMLMLMLMLM